MPEYRILTTAEKAVLEAAHNYAHAHDELRNIDPDKPETDSCWRKISCCVRGAQKSCVVFAVLRLKGSLPMESRSIAVQVNGVRIAANLEPRALLVQVLREQAGLTGTHIGCDMSQCRPPAMPSQRSKAWVSRRA